MMRKQMRRIEYGCLALLVAGALGARPVAAQTYVFAGGGVTVPSSKYADFAKAGWSGTAGLLFTLPQGILLGAQGIYGRNDHPDIEGVRNDLWSVLGLAYKTFGSPDFIMPFASLGVGYMKRSYKSDAPEDEFSGSGLALNVGAGVQFPLGPLRGFAQGVYTFGFGDVDEVKFVAANAGLSIPFGDGG